MSQAQGPAPIPTPTKYFLDVPPYEPIACVADDAWRGVLTIEFFSGTVDTFCLRCKQHSVFRAAAKPIPPRVVNKTRVALQTLDAVFKASECAFTLDGREYEVQPKVYALWERRFENRMTCTRCQRQELVVYSEMSSSHVLCKIGQTPSLADLHLPDLHQYREVLTEEKYRELVRAVGLEAHGVGIGAFVYLRRIFEELVEEAHGKARAVAGWDEDAFQSSRMSEKIGYLADHLPSFLVENRALYGIMSLGIHELTEKQCLEHFPIMRAGIEITLDEKLEAARKAKKAAATSGAVSKLQGILKGQPATGS